MGKHTSAEAKLHVSKEVRPARSRKLATPKDNSAPQTPKAGTNAKNQYR
jgi:hypothetical protein